MDDIQATQITNAMGREPGLILVTVRVGCTIQVFGHPMLTGFHREYPTKDLAQAMSAAHILAANEGLALLVDFQGKAPR